jgi:long-chain acyl-CoA synthetase
MGVPQPIALVVLSPAGKAKSKEEIISSMTELLAMVNKEVEAYERLQAAVIMKDDWTIANGLLTPSLKIRRNEVEKIHLPAYPHWYGLNQQVVWEELEVRS